MCFLIGLCYHCQYYYDFFVVNSSSSSSSGGGGGGGSSEHTSVDMGFVDYPQYSGSDHFLGSEFTLSSDINANLTSVAVKSLCVSVGLVMW